MYMFVVVVISTMPTFDGTTATVGSHDSELGASSINVFTIDCTSKTRLIWLSIIGTKWLIMARPPVAFSDNVE